MARGAQVEVPDQVATDVLKTVLPRTLLCADLDADGNYVMKTSPLHYEYVWLHNAAWAAEALARRGYFEEAKRHPEPGFQWQGAAPAAWGGEYTDWSGFFGVDPEYAAIIWVAYHGLFQRAAAWWTAATRQSWSQACRRLTTPWSSGS